MATSRWRPLAVRGAGRLAGVMTRFLFILVVLIAVVALFASSPRSRHVSWAVFVALAVYAVLKATGVIEALAPDRDGVF